jgi:hypothetical protein
MKMGGFEIGLLPEPGESFAEHLALSPTFRRLEAGRFQMQPSGRPRLHPCNIDGRSLVVTASRGRCWHVHEYFLGRSL